MSSLRNNIFVEPQELFTSSATQGTDIGAQATTGDGRVFRYTLAGGTTALVAGKLQTSFPTDTTNYQRIGLTAAAANATSITTGSTVTLGANEFTGGWLTIRTTPGVGYQYKIKSHPAATAATVTLTLEDPIQVATTAASEGDLTKNPYNGVVVSPTTATGVPVGVALVNTPAAQYGWLQTHGPINCLSDGAITIGRAVAASNSVAGALMAASGTQACVGYAMITTTDTKYAPFFLTIE